MGHRHAYVISTSDEVTNPYQEPEIAVGCKRQIFPSRAYANASRIAYLETHLESRDGMCQSRRFLPKIY